MPNSAERAAEFNRLIAEQGGLLRNMKHMTWVEFTNPLLLTTKFIGDLIEKMGPNAGVTVQIGSDKGGYYYQCVAHDLVNRNGMLTLTVPDSVAEHFRQQGRRQIQREIADTLALKSHL